MRIRNDKTIRNKKVKKRKSGKTFATASLASSASAHPQQERVVRGEGEDSRRDKPT